MSKKLLTDEQFRFVDDVASLLTPWGMPQTSARLYGYLLLNAKPVSLDRITEDLEISKSSASVAARLLERYLMARRHRVPSSKRVLYGASDNFAGLLAEQSALLGTMGRLLQERTSAVASGATAVRLQALSEFYLSMRESMEKSIKKLNASASRRRS